jgi:lipopolysaccharide/colanic/teichoic acid biosynthesis glycosyltransferase
MGNFVRKTSMDELPEFINVLKGDLSLIGPRPLLPLYSPLHNESQKGYMK